VWGRSAQVTSTTAEAWLGRPLASHPSPDAIVLRYFNAFGPAAVADVSAWSGLTGLREIVDRLRPKLQPFRDERGRELFDLPDAPRPPADTPAPPRFLPEYDNVLLSHADRSRFTMGSSDAWSAPIVRGTVLHDGMVVATWHIVRDREEEVLVVHHHSSLTKRARGAIAAEGDRFIGFHEGDRRPRDVRLISSAR
jgi:hypothetical protein